MPEGPARAVIQMAGKPQRGHVLRYWARYPPSKASPVDNEYGILVGYPFSQSRSVSYFLLCPVTSYHVLKSSKFPLLSYLSSETRCVYKSL